MLKNKNNLCLITTCLDLVMLLAVIVGIFIFIGAFTGAQDLLGDAFEYSSGSGASDGYEVLLKFGEGTIGLVGMIMIVAAIAGFAFVAVMLLPCVILGLIAYIRGKKQKIHKYKADSITKIVINGILAFICITSITATDPWWILVAILPSVVVGLSIYSLCSKDLNYAYIINDPIDAGNGNSGETEDIKVTSENVDGSKEEAEPSKKDNIESGNSISSEI